MMRLLITLSMFFTSSIATADNVARVDLTKIDRTIAKEPVYVAQPHYALLVFGMKAEHRTWLVMDGDRIAYFDRNGNGDLTEPDDRIELSSHIPFSTRGTEPASHLGMNVFVLGTNFGTNLTFRMWVRNPDYDPAKDKLHGAHYREYFEKQWVNGTLMRIAADQSQAQNPLLLTVRPQDASISHFNGPLEFWLAFGDRQEVMPWPKRSSLEINIGCRNLLAKDCSLSAFDHTTLTTTEIAADLHPVATISYRLSTADETQTSQNLILDQRCCGDRLYGPLRLPQGVEGRTVTAKVMLPPNDGLVVPSREFAVPINRGVTPHNEMLFVMFHNPDLTIKNAVNAFRKQGMDVNIEGEFLKIQHPDSLHISIRLNRAAEVQAMSAGLGLQTLHAESLAACESRFEVGFMESDKVLEDKQTMLAIQEVLQKLTKGFAYSTWDKQLTPPK